MKIIIFFKKYLKIKSQTSTAGFTFIEVVIYIGLLSFVLLILSQILTSVLSARLDSEATSSVQQDGNYILARFYYDVTRADSINFPLAPGDSETSLTITTNSEELTYSLAGNKLTLTSDTGSYELNSHDTQISELSFLRLGDAGGNNTITISFTLTSSTIKEGGQREVRNYQTTAGLR